WEFDDEDHDEDGQQSSESGGLPARRPLPTWLKTAFNDKMQESRNCVNGLPPLYCIHRTFWFPRPSTFFLLSKPVVQPPNLFNPRFFLWDPLPLCPNGIRCPNCTKPLRRHCEINRPRRCVDQQEAFFLIGYCYACSSCSANSERRTPVTFRSWDPRILQILP